MLPGKFGDLLSFVGTPPLPNEDEERHEAKEDTPLQPEPPHSNGDMVQATDEPNMGASLAPPPTTFQWLL